MAVLVQRQIVERLAGDDASPATYLVGRTAVDS